MFLTSYDIVKMFLKIMGRKKISIERLLYWAGVNWIALKKIISKALIDSAVGHDQSD